MADYCKTCSEFIFGEDYHDLAGLITEAKVAAGWGKPALCECCGPIIVNHLGERIGNAEKKCWTGCFGIVDRKNCQKPNDGQL